MLLLLHRNKLCIWLALDNSSQRLQWGDGREAQHHTEAQQGTDHSLRIHVLLKINPAAGALLKQKVSVVCRRTLPLSAYFICSPSPLSLSWLWACMSLRWQWTGRGLTEKDTSMSQSNQVRSNIQHHVIYIEKQTKAFCRHKMSKTQYEAPALNGILTCSSL